MPVLIDLTVYWTQVTDNSLIAWQGMSAKETECFSQDLVVDSCCSMSFPINNMAKLQSRSMTSLVTGMTNPFTVFSFCNFKYFLFSTILGLTLKDFGFFFYTELCKIYIYIYVCVCVCVCIVQSFSLLQATFMFLIFFLSSPFDRRHL